MGYVYWNKQYQLAQFQYDDDFARKNIEPSPIKMPVKQGYIYSFGDLNYETFKGLPGMLADALPDTYGRVLLDKWLMMNGRTDANPIEALCFLGKRCMGTLEFEPSFADNLYDNTVQFEWNELVQVAREALSNKLQFHTNLSQDTKSAIEQILQLGTSAGGQRAKAVVAYNKQTGEVRSGQIDAPEGFDHYLIKLDAVSGLVGSRETENYGRLEYSFSQLAKACGIEMTECLLIEENGRAHFITKRFDRIGTQKVHMQTLCGIAHYDYRLLRAYSYEHAFNIMRGLRLTYQEAQEMFRRMVFNVVVRNQDDHTKNISFLMDESGQWRLSPAYDIGYAYNPKGAWTATHQMSVNGKFDTITRQDLLVCAERNNIKNANDIIEEVVEASSQWATIAKENGVPQTIIEDIAPKFLLHL